jgi:hypothetical protein
MVTLPEVVMVSTLFVMTAGPEVTAKVTGRFEPPPVATRLTESVVSWLTVPDVVNVSSWLANHTWAGGNGESNRIT